MATCQNLQHRTNPSNNLVAFVTKEEGCVLHAYLDQAGKWTIGIGSTMYPSGGAGCGELGE